MSSIDLAASLMALAAVLRAVAVLVKVLRAPAPGQALRAPESPADL